MTVKGFLSRAWRKWRYRGERRKTHAWRSDVVAVTFMGLLVAGLVVLLTVLTTR